MQKEDIVSANKLLITQQEMVLIKNSNEVKNHSIYGNLYDCLESYTKLSKRELEKNIAFDKKATITLLNVDNKKIMMTNIIKEWYSVKDCNIAEPKIKCQLCGTPNKFIFYIRNRITDVELHIGRDCVKNFADIIGIKQEINKSSQIEKEYKRQMRKTEFESLEGEDFEFLENAETKFKNFNVLLPYKLNNQIKDTLYQLNLIKSSYIKSGGKIQEIIKKYNILKNQFDKFYAEAEIHYDKVKNKLLVCDKVTSDWLLSNDVDVWETVAKNNGLFDVDTLKSVYLNSFVVQRLEELRKHLNDADIKIIQVYGKSILFSINNSRFNYSITFMITIKKFMETIGCYCLTDKNYYFDKNDLQDISIENTNRNFEALYNSVFSLLNSFGYDFVTEEKTAQSYWKKLNYSVARNRWSRHTHHIAGMYKKSDKSLFLSVLSPFLLKEEDFLKKNFEYVKSKMENGRVWITQREKDESEQAIKEARGLQKRKEFTPY